MPGKQSKMVTFSPDISEKPKVSHKNGAGKNKKRVIKIWSFRLPKTSGFALARFVNHLGAEVARALRSVSTRRRTSGKVASPSLARSRSYAEPLDSHRAEAIADCIEFLNSSSSYLERSKSVSTSSC